MRYMIVVGKHEFTGEQVFELRDGDRLVCTIVPREDGLKVVSKRLRRVTLDEAFPPAALLEFTEANHE